MDGNRSQRKVRWWGEKQSFSELPAKSWNTLERPWCGSDDPMPRNRLWWLICHIKAEHTKTKATYFVQMPPVHLPLLLWESPEACELGWSRPTTGAAWGWACWWCGWGRSEENLPPGSEETMQAINLFFQENTIPQVLKC